MQYLKHLQSELSEILWISHREPNKQRDSNVSSCSSNTFSCKENTTTKDLVHVSHNKQTITNQPNPPDKKFIEGKDSSDYSNEIRSFSKVTNNSTENLGVYSSQSPHSKVISTLRTSSSSINVHSSPESKGKGKLADSSPVEPVILSLTPLTKSIRKEYYSSSSRASSLDKDEYQSSRDQFERQTNNNNLLVVVDDPLLHLFGVGPLIQEEKEGDNSAGSGDAEKAKIIFVTSATSSTPSITFPNEKIDRGKRRSSIAISNIYSTQNKSNLFKASRQIHSSRERAVDNASIRTISKAIQDREEKTGLYKEGREETASEQNFLHHKSESRDLPETFTLSAEKERASTEKELDFGQSLAVEDLHGFTSRFTTFTREGAYSSSDSLSRCSSTTSISSSRYTTSDSIRTSISIPKSEDYSVLLHQEGEEGDINTPVVIFDNQKFGLPLLKLSSNEGLSCSYKVNQRKKNIPPTGSNITEVSDSQRNVNTQTATNIPRVTKRGSIIRYLLCTKGFSYSQCTPKYLLRAIFSPSQGNRKRLKRRKDGEKPETIPLFSLCFPKKFDREHRQNSNIRRRKKSRRLKRAIKSNSYISRKNDRHQGPTKSELKLWVTMDHEDLIRELPQIEKLSNQERLRLAHKRRMLQLKKFQQYEKELNSNSKNKHRGESDLVRRNLPGKHQHHGGRKGSRRIRFRNSIMLLEAAGRNDVEEVRLLLESGVNADVANEDGLTALHQCCIDDNEEMMKLLLDYGANVNSEDSEKWTPLHAAATCGHLHLVQYLIARGANLLAVNAEGNMPYDICDDETTLDYIESEMAKRGVTQELIEEIRALPETRMLQEIQRIHTLGGDLECRDVDGATPLHIASANGYYRVAEFLLDNHAATDVQDKDFWQPIHAAACWGHLDVLELLVQNGADLDARTKNNETPYAICEDPEIKERIIQLRTEQQTKRQNEGRKRPSRTHSTNSRTQSIRRTSQRDKGLTSKRDAADEAQMLRAREELHKENSPSPTSDAVTGGSNGTTVTIVNGNGLDVPPGQNNGTHQNGNTSSEEDPEMTLPPSAILGRDSVGNMKMKQDEMNRLREIAVKSGAVNHNNHLNNQNNIHNNTSGNASSNGSGGIKMNNLYNESNGSLRKNQNNIQKNLNNASNGAPGNSTVGVLSSPDDNGNLLPKPEINPSVDSKVPLGGGLCSAMPLSGSRDNLVGLSSSAGNSTIDIHVSVTINTNSPVSTLTNGGSSGGPGSLGVGHGHNSPSSNHIPLSPGSAIFTPPGTLSDLKKQRSLIRTSSNPLTNGGMNDAMGKYHPPASPTMSLRRYVGDPSETVGDYGDGGKRCCVIV